MQFQVNCRMLPPPPLPLCVLSLRYPQAPKRWQPAPQDPRVLQRIQPKLLDRYGNVARIMGIKLDHDGSHFDSWMLGSTKNEEGLICQHDVAQQ